MSDQAVAPDQVLCHSDNGDDVQRRFRYQAAYAALICLELLSDNTEFSEIFCEHQEDILVKRHDGQFIGLQVKTRADSESYKSTDEPIITALQHFLSLEAEFEGQFSHYALITNTGFWSKERSGKNLQHLITEAQTQTASPTRILSDFLLRVAPANHPNHHLACSVLQKVHLDRAAEIDGIYHEVVARLALLEGMDQRPHASLKRAATHLVNAILEASSLPPSPLRHCIALLSNPAQVYAREVISQKRFTPQRVQALLNEVLIAPQLQDADQQLRQTLSASLVQIQTQIAALGTSALIIDSGTSKEEVYGGKLDIVRDLLHQGKPVDARFVLEKLRDEINAAGVTLPLALQARMENNFGACAFDLADWETAIYYFRLAHQLDPTQAKYLANEANVALLKKEDAEALRLCEQARELNPQDVSATSVYIQALQGTGQEDCLESFLQTDAWVMKDPSCAAAIGMVRHEQGRDAEAEPYLRFALEHTPEAVPISLTLVSVIVWPLQQRLMTDSVFKQLDPHTQKRLEEAETLLAKAIVQSERLDNRSFLHAALVSRAGVRYLLDKNNEGLQDCDRVLLENPIHIGALENKGRLLQNMEKFGEAIPCFESILLHEDASLPSFFVSQNTNQRRAGIARMLAYCYLQTEQPQRVLPLLDPYWNPTTAEPEQLALAELRLIAQDQMNDLLQVDVTLQTLTTIWGEHPDALAVRAHACLRRGHMTEATDALKRSRELAQGKRHKQLTLELAEHYFALGRYDEASPLFSQAVDRQTDNPWLRKYVISLFKSGQSLEALKVAQDLRRNGDPIPVISQIEAQVLEQMGNLHAARELYRKLSETPTNTARHRIRGIILDLRLGDRISAAQEVEKVTFDAIKDDAEALMTMAQARADLELPDALLFAYRAKQIAPDTPEIQVAYFTVLVQRETIDRALLGPKVVDLDCVVHLRRSDEKRTYKIVPGFSNYENNELGISDRLTEKIRGKQVGDSVELGTGRIYEITEIQSKYVYSFQNICREFHSHFDDFPGFQQFEVKDDDLSEMLALIDGRHEHITQVIDMYRQRLLPLSFVARRVGYSIADVWSDFTRSKDKSIFLASGNVAEEHQESITLANSNLLVLDMVAVLTLLHLGIVEVVRQRFPRLLTSQWMVEAISRDLAAEYRQDRATGTIGKTEKGYFWLEHSPEEHVERQKFLEKVRDFILTNTEPMASPLILEIAEDARKRMEEIVGQDVLGTVLLAKEHNCPLLSDDWVLRTITRQEWSVAGVSSQSVLRELVRSNHLNEDNYYDAVVKLSRANYTFVRMDVQGLISVLERNIYSINTQVRGAFRLFEGPVCDAESAIDALGEVIKRVWPRILVDAHKPLILDLVLETLVQGRERGRDCRLILNLFESKLIYKFRVISHYLSGPLV